MKPRYTWTVLWDTPDGWSWVASSFPHPAEAIAWLRRHNRRLRARAPGGVIAQERTR